MGARSKGRRCATSANSGGGGTLAASPFGSSAGVGSARDSGDSAPKLGELSIWLATQVQDPVVDEPGELSSTMSAVLELLKRRTTQHKAQQQLA